MKGRGIIHPQLLRVLAEMGHTDTLVVADAGLPIPPDVERVDLGLTRGVPSFVQTLKAIAGELTVESITMADEARHVSPHVVTAVSELFPGVPIRFVPHVELKAMTRSARAVVRTGEFTPYANVILQSGVGGLFQGGEATGGGSAGV